MKKIFIILVLISIVSLSFAKDDLEINRTNLWSRLSLSGKIGTNGFGYVFNFGSRYNIGISKTLNGQDKDIDKINAWLQEFWIGGSYSKKLNDKLSYTTRLLYRPRIFFIDEVGGDSYTLQTFTNHQILKYKFNKKTSVLYRLILWDALENKDAKKDAEFYTRHLLELGYNLSKKVALKLQGELILKHTADTDGEETLFMKNIFVGTVYKINKKSGIKVFFKNTYKNAKNTDTLQKTITDYYLELTYFYKLNF